MQIIFDNVQIGNKFAELRQKKNLSIEKLSNMVMISVKTLERIEGGLKTPDIYELISICKFYQEKIDNLLFYSIKTK